MVPGLNTALLMPRQAPPQFPPKHQSDCLGTGTGLDFYFLTPASPSLPYKTTKFTLGRLRLWEKDRAESQAYSVAQAGLQLTKARTEKPRASASL